MIRTAAVAILLATSFIAHASEQAKSKADPAKGKVVAENICVACHSADGNSLTSANPHLAGQVEEYIYKQLKNKVFYRYIAKHLHQLKIYTKEILLISVLSLYYSLSDIT